MESTRTQCDIILDILEGGGTITNREAMFDYGIGRLASRINDLKRQGYPVKSRSKKVPNRLGGTSTVAEYYMDAEG